MRRFSPSIALSLALLAGACAPEPREEPPHLLYSADAQSLDNPFPDQRLVVDGSMTLRPDWYRPFLMPKAVTAKMNAFLTTYAEAAHELDGFGNFGPTLLRMSAPVDRASLTGVAARLRKTDSGYEVVEADVAVEHSLDSLEGTGKEAPEGFPEFLVVRPSVSLPESTDGLLVIKRGLRTVDGVELGRGFDFEAEPETSERIRAAAQALGIEEEEVLLALPFRTLPVSAPLKSAVQWAAQATPSFEIPAKGRIAEGAGERLVGPWTSADSDWSVVDSMLTAHPSFSNPPADVGSVTSGTFVTRDLRENGVWRADWVDDPGKAPAATLNWVLSLPAGARPQGGWKVVIGAHGLNGRNTPHTRANSFCLEVAQLLAKHGFGCLGIDAPSHGTRGNAFEFFAVEDLRRARDNFRQAAFDMAQLATLVSALDVDGDQQPDLDPDFGYFGNSLGGIMGGNYVSVDERVGFAVLNVPGGGLSNILTGPMIRDQIGLLLVAKSGLTFGSVEYYSAFPLFRTVGQLFLETGDPVNVGQLSRATPRPVLIQEGVGDRTIPNFTTENLAAAMGLELATESSTGTGPLRRYTRNDPAQYGLPASFNGHNVLWEIEPVRTQVVSFLGSRGTQLIVE